ncbi:MAG: hypothetical protein K9G41_09280 [Flavobacteriales bacterium]|nr:hypothetical protein [Flavobacteriales bacterium]
MKRLAKLTVLLLFGCAIEPNTSFAQIYSSPEPKDKGLIEVKKEEAIAEASEMSKACGYSHAYISTEDLFALTNISKSVGIRVYNSKESIEQSSCDVIVVAVDAEGKEIGSGLNSKYVQIQSPEINKSCPSRRISKSKASGCVSNTIKTDLTYQKVFFSNESLMARIKIPGATGIKLIPGKFAAGSTMMIVAAKLESGSLIELEANYLKSQLPCPTDCGDSGNYLVAPN